MYRLLSRCTLHPIFSIVVSMLTEVSIKLSFYRIIFCSILPWCDSMSEALSDITSVCLMRTECTSHKANRCTVETVLFCLFEVLFPCVYSQWSHIETAFFRLLSYCCTRAVRVHYYFSIPQLPSFYFYLTWHCVRCVPHTISIVFLWSDVTFVHLVHVHSAKHSVDWSKSTPCSGFSVPIQRAMRGTRICMIWVAEAAVFASNTSTFLLNAACVWNTVTIPTAAAATAKRYII